MNNQSPVVEARVLSYYDHPIELNKEINILLKDDWELYGELVVSIAKTMTVVGYDSVTLIYSQTMVKRNREQQVLYQSSHCPSLQLRCPEVHKDAQDS